MHRKVREIPAGVIAGSLVLAALVAALLFLLSAATAPAAASPAMLQPAVSAASQLRPVWDGSHPKRWTGQDAMCPASSYRLHRWARADKSGPWFRVECQPIGPAGFYAWNAIIKH